MKEREKTEPLKHRPRSHRSRHAGGVSRGGLGSGETWQRPAISGLAVLGSGKVVRIELENQSSLGVGVIHPKGGVNLHCTK